jgi:hypothetical protein
LEEANAFVINRSIKYINLSLYIYDLIPDIDTSEFKSYGELLKLNKKDRNLYLNKFKIPDDLYKLIIKSKKEKEQFWIDTFM